MIHGSPDEEPSCSCEERPAHFPSDWLELNNLLRTEITRLCNDDEFLLRNGASERSLAHRLGLYLQETLPEWNVDCEYNRIGNTTNMKLQPRDELCNKLDDVAAALGFTPHLAKARLELKCARVDAGHSNLERRAYPDLIVHKRGCELHNLLLIEIKTIDTEPWMTLIDYAKLHSFTLKIRRVLTNKTLHYPRYRFGLFLEFGEEDLASALLFRHGEFTILNEQLGF